jgi:hypothetical protein
MYSKKRKTMNKQIEDIQNENINKEHRKLYQGVKELRTEYKFNLCKLVEKQEEH